MKRKILLAIMFVCGEIVTGCQHKGIESTVEIKKMDFPSSCEKVESNVRFCTKINVSEDANRILYESKAFRIEAENDKLVASLLAVEGKKDTIQQPDQWSYIDEKGQMLYIDKDYVSYLSNSKEYDELMELFLPSFQTKSLGDGISDFNNTEFLNKKEKIEQKINAMNIHNFKLYKCYEINRIDANTPKVDKNENSEMRADGIYWLGIEKWQGLPVISSMFYNGITDAWAPIQILETSRGIEKIQILYNLKFEKIKHKIQLQPFSKIAEALEQEYSMILTSNKYDIMKAEMCFWTDIVQDEKEFVMEPVWVFTIHEYKPGEEDNYTEYQEVYSAVTAKSVVKTE